MGNYDELPQEIMLDILCRVPAKSVGLCRCVSKPWRALLSQPDFIKTHVQHAKTNSLESLAITDVEGCLHWLYTRPTDGKVGIVAFDLVHGKVREVPLPSSMLDDLQGFYIAELFWYKLGVLEGCLCMSYGGEVWVMKEYGVSNFWTKFVVKQPYDLLGCSLSKQERVLIRLHDDYHYLWNLKQATTKKIVFNGFTGGSGDLHVKANVVESLVSPHDKL